MAKKQEEKSEKVEDYKKKAPEAPQQEQMPQLPKEVAEKLKQIKEKLDKFQKAIVEKFDKYIMGISLLPPARPEEGHEIAAQELFKKSYAQLSAAEKTQAEQEYKNKVNVLILVDDTDSQKMTKEELRDKLTAIMKAVAADIDKNLAVQTLILSELWQSCYDGKHDLLQMIAVSAPIYDLGMLSAIKIAEVHKTMVLKKFEKYIVSYVLAGSLVQGKATKESDIDVFVVIDDTDVKKMTRAELKDKLRAIIIGMGFEAGSMTGIQNKINIQVYILTDFWDSIREANPIIFTFLRDGIPFYDRGIFMPWKQLLRMGRIKPSPEAIDMYMSSGEQMVKRVQLKLNEIGMEDLFYALLTPSQAALMMYGMPPPTPKETPQLLREVFVDKEKLMEDSYVKILERVIKLRKDLEHGTKKDVSGKEVDELMKDSDRYLQRLKELFTQIEDKKEAENTLGIYETIVTVIRDILRLEGVERVKDVEVVKLFEEELVHLGKVPEKYLRMVQEVMKAKKDFDAGKLTKVEIDKIKKDASPLIKFLVEYIQRKRGRELERTKLKVKYGDKHGEITLLDDTAFIIIDLDAQEKEILKAPIKPNGGLGAPVKSSFEELEKHLAKYEIPPRVFIKEPAFEDLKRIFGRDVEVLVNY